MKIVQPIRWPAIAWAAARPLLPGAHAEVRLPKVFGSHMVLQQEKPLVIWGWAQPNETVTVQLAHRNAAGPGQRTRRMEGASCRP